MFEVPSQIQAMTLDLADPCLPIEPSSPHLLQVKHVHVFRSTSVLNIIEDVNLEIVERSISNLIFHILCGSRGSLLHEARTPSYVSVLISHASISATLTCLKFRNLLVKSEESCFLCQTRVFHYPVAP